MIQTASIKSAILGFAIFWGALVFGQQKPIATDNEQDKKYTPNPNSIFNNLDKRGNSSGLSDITVKNILKFCPTMILRQKVVFFYEREIVKNVSLNLGIGKAFGDDFFQKSYFETLTYSTQYNVLILRDMLSNSKYNSSGPYLYAGIRQYFSRSTFDGGFIEIAYRHETFNYLLDSTINSYKVLGSNRAAFTMNAFSFGYGFIGLSGPQNNISHEFFINFGIKYIRYTQFDEIQVSNPYGFGSERVYQQSNVEQKTRILPSLNIGYIFGFGF